MNRWNSCLLSGIALGLWLDQILIKVFMFLLGPISPSRLTWVWSVDSFHFALMGDSELSASLKQALLGLFAVWLQRKWSSAHSYRKSNGRSKLTYHFHKGICWELPTIFTWALCSQIHLGGNELSVTMTKLLKKSICQVWIALNGIQVSQVKGPTKLTEVGSHIDMTSIGEHVN